MGGRVELLAPAGSPDALRAAVAAGADAVYAGLGAFNARAGNAGLTLEELACGCALAHAHGARVYVTLNIYLHDRELGEAVSLARGALDAGADALIVADAGLCLRLREEMPGVELHLSTQAGVQSAPAARLAAREFGVERVTCARELSVAELAELAAAGVHVEAFCHGAICICYSGACSYSALMRGRSANRGDCVQPCRLAYELQDGAGRVLAGGLWAHPAAAPVHESGRCRGAGPASAADAPARAGAVAGDAPLLRKPLEDKRFEGDRLLCPRDYLGIRHIPELVAAGVHALKIEGRMKGADYVYNAVRCYRAALDAALAGRVLGVEELDGLEAQLARSFSRGFTDGYLTGGHVATGAGLMSFERAINQGLPVGTVAESRHEEVAIEFSRPVAAGDMLEIRSTPGADRPVDVPKRWPIVTCPVDAAAGERVVLRCKRKVERGSAVHMVRSAACISEAAAAVEAMRAEEELLCADASKTAPDFGHRDGKKGTSVSKIGGQSELRRDLALAGPAVAFSVIDAAPLDLGEVCRSSDLAAARGACDRAARGEATSVICRNFAHVQLALEAGAPWEAAPPLNVWNAGAARWLASLGARRIWLPEELDDQDERELRAACGDAPLGLCSVPAGSTPLMIAEHCLLTAEGPCDHRCAMCERRAASARGERILVELDRNSGGNRLRVEVDLHGRTRLYRTDV